VADRKISDLTALTTPATGDLIPIVDVSEAAAADKNKSITVGELLRGAPDGTAAAPGIAFESDGDNGMFLGGTDILAFSTGGTQAVTIDASQRLGVGTASPGNYAANADNLVVSSTGITGITIASGTTSTGNLFFADGTTGNEAYRGYLIYDHSSDFMRFGTADVERARIDSSGRLLVGTPTARSWLGVNSRLQLEGTGYEGASQSWTLNQNSADGVYLGLTKTRGSALNSNTIVQDNDVLGGIYFNGTDGSVPRTGAQITSQVDGTPGADVMPACLRFLTNGGAASPIERVRISPGGNVGIGITDPEVYYGNAVVVYAGSEGGITIRNANGTTTNYLMFASSDTGADRYNGFIGYGHNTDRMVFAASSSTRMSLSSDGLAFGSDTAAANSLDDYEEGTWQPTVTVGTVGYAFARYTKIGRQVTVAARINTFSNRTSTNAVVVQNLPYDSDGSNPQAGGSAFFRYVNDQFTTVYVDGDDLLFYRGGSGAFDSMQHQDITDSTSEIYFFATYFTA
jgi:hypothetical protein